MPIRYKPQDGLYQYSGRVVVLMGSLINHQMNDRPFRCVAALTTIDPKNSILKKKIVVDH